MEWCLWENSAKIISKVCLSFLQTPVSNDKILYVASGSETTPYFEI